MSCEIDGHACNHCGMGWVDADHEISASEIYGCTEWHRCHCDAVIDVDPDTVPDFPCVVGHPDIFGGSCHTNLAAAQSHAIQLSRMGQRMAVKTRDDDGRPTVIAHLYEAGQEIKETR